MNKMKALRLVSNSALLFAAVSGAIYLTGCSSEDGISNGNVSESPLDTDSYSVYSADQNRVHNYGNSSTRAGEYVEAANSFDMPECPAIPAGIATTTGIGENEGWKISEGVDFLIPAGETFSEAFKAAATYYVAGTLNLKKGLWGVVSGAKIIVMPGGTLNMNSTIQPGLTIYNYGDLISDTGICVAAGVKVYSAVDILGVSSFSVNGSENGNPAGEFYSRGAVQSDGAVRLNGNAIACGFSANEIVINSNGTIKTSYLKADNLTLSAGSVVLDDNGLVEAKKLNIFNGDTRFTVNGTNAVVAGDEFNTNNLTWPKDIFASQIAVDFKKYLVGNNSQKWDDSEYTKNDFEFQVSSEEQVVYVPSAGCHGEYGTKPAAPSTPELVKVTDIEPITLPTSNHAHEAISATCVNFDGNNAYVSYHLRGAEVNGCIEVIKDNNAAGFALGSYMVAPDYDFNHLIVDNGKIVTVGSHVKKGAFIGSLPVSFEVGEGSERTDFTVKELTTEEVIKVYSDKTKQNISAGYKNAIDGNCVVRQGDYYYVATTSGYGAVKADDFSKVLGSFKATTGSSKHLSINGGKTAVLSLDSDSETSSTASVKVYGADDKTFATVLNSYDAVGTIAPVDGKNVVAVDGDNIYVCLSQGGLLRVNDNKTFKRGSKVPANGVAFDDKYVYVANGSFVSVLDKTDLHEVCYYHAASSKSANYVAVNNGKIYVAFGEDGLQVYQITEKTVE